MKKVVALFLALSMVFALCGCGKSEAVKSVEEMIESIGTVTRNSEAKIQKAELAYKNLSEKEKNQVSNYNVLLEARNKYDALPIPITTDNFSDYLKVKFTPSNAEVSTYRGLTVGQSYDLETEIYPVKSGGFNNLEVEIRVTLPMYWHVALNDPAYVKETAIPESEYKDSAGNIKDFDKYTEANTHYMTLKLTIPSNGTYSETHCIAREFMTQSLSERDFKYEIVSIKGTFVK